MRQRALQKVQYSSAKLFIVMSQKQIDNYYHQTKSRLYFEAFLFEIIMLVEAAISIAGWLIPSFRLISYIQLQLLTLAGDIGLVR